jgi:putative inorganic carbon (HCO3(-)) transporter
LIDSEPLMRALWICTMVISIAAAVINASKGALIVFIIIFFLLGCIFIWSVRRIEMSQRKFLATLAGSIVLITAILVIAFSGGTKNALDRWLYAFNSKQTITEGRITTSQICYRISKQAGPWGFGPATFSSIFPYTQKIFKKSPTGFWQYAHQDFLQTLIEWGYIGTSAWSILFFGAMAYAAWNLFRLDNEMRKRDKFLLLTCLVSLFGIILHSTIDFPLQIPSLQFYTIIILAFCWSSQTWKRPLEEIKTPRKSRS